MESTYENQTSKKENKEVSAIAGSILLSGVLIAGAILYTSGSGGVSPKPTAPSTNNNTDTELDIDFRPITNEDHIWGSINAPVKIIEYSDLECPFCKRFHETMHQLVDEYEGKVAWVYRHLPLTSLHVKAFREAEASECAYAQGGNEVFWKYIDRIFEITPSNDGLENRELTNTARILGLDVAKFTSCLENGDQKSKVEADIDDAANAGARGTPYSLVVVDGKAVETVGGAVPYSRLKQVVDEALE